MSAPNPNKYVDDLLGPMDPVTEEDDNLPIGDQGNVVSGSEDEPPEIQPMSVDENEEIPAAAMTNDKPDLVEPPTPPVEEPAAVEPKEPAQAELPLDPPATPPTPPEPAVTSEAGLRKEIVRLRAELKRGEVTGGPPATQQPAPLTPGYGPPSPGVSTAPTEAPLPNVPGAQVVVSEDGQQVYLPDSEINRRVDERVQAAMQPTPQQAAQMAAQQMEHDFMSADPERNAPAVQKFRDVDEFLGLKLAGLQSQGYTPQSVPELTHTLKVMGVETEFAQFFPETAPMFDELIAATASQQPAWKRSILERMAVSPSITPTPVPPIQLESVEGNPQSLTRKGGSRSVAPEAAKAEFKALETKFHADPVSLPKAEYERYKELGRKLGEDGFESI